MQAHITSSAAMLERIRHLLAQGGRRIIGIVGEPGAGKSTVAAAIGQTLGNEIPLAIVPMDGFHLANVELDRLGRAERKGAADTFDAAGYVSLLQRLRGNVGNHDDTIYAPAFHRDIEEAIAGEIPIAPDTQLIITEGNYLLLDDAPWCDIRVLLDESWFISIDREQRRQQLLTRHLAYGRSREAALAWIDHTDEPNAHRIAACSAKADCLLKLPPLEHDLGLSQAPLEQVIEKLKM